MYPSRSYSRASAPELKFYNAVLIHTLRPRLTGKGCDVLMAKKLPGQLTPTFSIMVVTSRTTLLQPRPTRTLVPRLTRRDSWPPPPLPVFPTKAEPLPAGARDPFASSPVTVAVVGDADAVGGGWMMKTPLDLGVHLCDPSWGLRCWRMWRLSRCRLNTSGATREETSVIIAHEESGGRMKVAPKEGTVSKAEHKQINCGSRRGFEMLCVSGEWVRARVRMWPWGGHGTLPRRRTLSCQHVP